MVKPIVSATANLLARGHTEKKKPLSWGVFCFHDAINPNTCLTIPALFNSSNSNPDQNCFSVGMQNNPGEFRITHL